MNNRKYEDLKEWEQAFFDLNEKVGNEAWGARLEGSGRSNSSNKLRLRIFINSTEAKEQVLKETNGVLNGYSLVFTVYTQEAHSQRESRHSLERTVTSKVKGLIEKPNEIEIDVEEYDK